MKCLYLILLIVLTVNTNASHTEKKFRRKLQELDNAYSLMEDEMLTEDLSQLGQIPVPSNSGNVSNVLRFAQTESGNSLKNGFKTRSKIRTFGTDFNIKPAIQEQKEVTYRKPIYVDYSEGYKPASADYETSTSSSDEDTKFLETFSNLGSSSNFITQSKDIVFNSNQVDYETGSYRKAFVIGEARREAPKIKTPSKENFPSEFVGVDKVHPIKKTKNHLTSIQNISEVKKLQNSPANDNVSTLIKNTNISENNNIIPSAPSVTPILTDFNKIKVNNSTSISFFNNEKEVSDLSLRLANLFKNILLDIIKSKPQDVEKIVQNRTSEVEQNIKASLKKLRKPFEIKKASPNKIKNIIANNTATTIINVEHINEISKKMNEIKIEKEQAINSHYSEINKDKQQIVLHPEINLINKIKKIRQEGLEKERMINSTLEKLKEKIKNEKKKLEIKKAPLVKIDKLLKADKVEKILHSEILSKTSVPLANKIISDKKTKLDLESKRVVVQEMQKGKMIKKSITPEVKIKKITGIVIPKNTEKVMPTKVKSVTSPNNPSVDVDHTEFLERPKSNRYTITEIEKQILAKIPKKLPIINKPLSVATTDKLEKEKIKNNSPAPAIQPIQTKTPYKKLNLNKGEDKKEEVSHIDKLIKDNAEKLRKIKEASEKLKAKLNLPETPNNEEKFITPKIIQPKKLLKEVKEVKVVKEVKKAKKIKEEIKTSEIPGIKEDFDDSSVISDLLKNLGK
jgi:hypothetical protein